jgi:hypothetical protein
MRASYNDLQDDKLTEKNDEICSEITKSIDQKNLKLSEKVIILSSLLGEAVSHPKILKQIEEMNDAFMKHLIETPK